MERKKTAVEWLIEELEDNHYGFNCYEKLIKQAKEMEKQMLCDLVEQLKDYTNESKSILGHDEREPVEFVEIFLKERD